MPRFNAVLLQSGYTPLDPPGDFQVDGTVLDNSGLFYAGDIQPGNVYYSNGTPMGYPLVIKYRVVSIVDISNPPLASIIVRQEYPNPSDAIYEPQYEGIIGEANTVGLMQLPDLLLSGVTSDFLNGVRNYQNDLLNSALLILGNGSIAPIVAGADRVYNAEYLGDKDGFNTAFYTLYNYVPLTSTIHLNGQKLTLTSDYTEDGIDGINLTFAPQADDVLTIEYTRAI
jgi:hypothetical protein